MARQYWVCYQGECDKYVVVVTNALSTPMIEAVGASCIWQWHGMCCFVGSAGMQRSRGGLK